jgi:alkanesulfonate monooxygenase SsuD/methylene tetrahydromethanopterin reductase-like flavin-dependent oxidoreductase (luciferase family)
MHYGISAPNFGEYSDPRLLAALAHEAEIAGWDGFFPWDHITWPGPVPVADPWVVLAAMAMQTERILLGPMVTAPPRRRPWKLARETVTLDHLSGGRLILGVGLGFWQHEEFEALGEAGSPQRRAAKLDESLAVLTGLWSGTPFSYHGTQYQVNNVCFLPTPVQQPRIPIWVAGGWPTKAPFRRAARWDGVFPINRDPANTPPLTPSAMRDVVAYVKVHRVGEAPFEVVYAGQTPGRDPAADAALVVPYAEAGVTWWLELASRRAPAEMRERIRRGPPSA